MPGSRPRIKTTLLCVLLAASHAVADAAASSSSLEGADARTQTDGVQAEAGETVAQLISLVEGEGKKDSDAWYRLGLAHDRAGDLKSAREAFRKALKLRSGHVAARAGLAYTFYVEGNLEEAEREAHLAYLRMRGGKMSKDNLLALDIYSAAQLQRFRLRCREVLPRVEAIISADPGDARAHLLRAQSLIGLTIPEQRRISLHQPPPPATPDEAAQQAAREANKKLYAEAVVSLENYLRLAPKADDASHMRGQLDALRFYAGGGESDAGGAVYQQSKVTTKAVIKSKPEPGFTSEAREDGVAGIIRVRAVLAADGSVKHVLVLKPLSHGLAERVVRAARDIKFTPAVLDGRPVSQHVLIEYTFNIY